jgi:hypothetical protein
MLEVVNLVFKDVRIILHFTEKLTEGVLHTNPHSAEEVVVATVL